MLSQAETPSWEYCEVLTNLLYNDPNSLVENSLKPSCQSQVTIPAELYDVSMDIAGRHFQ